MHKKKVPRLLFSWQCFEMCVHEIAIHTAKISARLGQRKAFIDLKFCPYYLFYYIYLSVKNICMDLLGHVKTIFLECID